MAEYRIQREPCGCIYNATTEIYVAFCPEHDRAPLTDEELDELDGWREDAIWLVSGDDPDGDTSSAASRGARVTALLGRAVAELRQARADNVVLTARVKQLESALAISPLPDLLDSVADLLADLHEVTAASRLRGQAAMLRLAFKGDGPRG